MPPSAMTNRRPGKDWGTPERMRSVRPRATAQIFCSITATPTPRLRYLSALTDLVLEPDVKSEGQPDVLKGSPKPVAALHVDVAALHFQGKHH